MLSLRSPVIIFIPPAAHVTCALLFYHSTSRLIIPFSAAHCKWHR